jgi:hypothetical protein
MTALILSGTAPADEKETPPLKKHWYYHKFWNGVLG